MKSKRPLEEFAKNIHSQAGEDGILTEILDRIGVFSERRRKWCVEFGAGAVLAGSLKLANL